MDRRSERKNRTCGHTHHIHMGKAKKKKEKEKREKGMCWVVFLVLEMKCTILMFGFERELRLREGTAHMCKQMETMAEYSVYVLELKRRLHVVFFASTSNTTAQVS